MGDNQNSDRYLSGTARATHYKFSVEIHRVDQNKSASKQFGKSIHRRSQGVSRTFRALIYKAHSAVIFAIAQLSYFVFCAAFLSTIVKNGCQTSKLVHSIHLILSDLMSSFRLNWVFCEATQFAVVATNQSIQRDLLRSDWSQLWPRRLGSLHDVLSSGEMTSDETRLDEMRDMNAPLYSKINFHDVVWETRFISV